MIMYALCKTSHKMNGSSQSPENDKKVVYWSTYHKRYYAMSKELDAYRRLLNLPMALSSDLKESWRRHVLCFSH